MKTKALESWEKDILRCIRCAYCFVDCPILKELGWESAGARSKVILSYGLKEGEIECNQLIKERLFQCCLCAQCEINCPAKVKVAGVVRAVRKDLVEAGHYFEAHRMMKEMVKKTGNLYGEERRDFHHPRLGAEYALFVGCVGKYREEESLKRTLELLGEVGTSFTTIEEVCCGGVFGDVGFQASQEDAEHIKEEIKKTKAKKLLTTCPMCYRTFKEDPRFKHLGVQVLHITQLLEKLEFPVKTSRAVTYHDPCDLGRHSDLYEVPRNVIRKFAPNFQEMAKNRENAHCCGAGGGVRGSFTRLSINMAKKRLQEAIDTGAEVLLTECPSCLHNFKNAKKRKQKIEIYNISEYLSLLMNGEVK